jgi:hypothetical protein
MNKQATGVFMWDAHERRSNRYGSFYLTKQTFSKTATASVHVPNDIDSLAGKRVHVKATVLAARQSGHCGDMFLNIFPSMPEIGEVIDLGVAVLHLTISLSGDREFTLVPNDDRKELWLDPHLLYRLHDQEVRVEFIDTEKEFTAPPVMNIDTEMKGAKVTSDGNTFQVKNVELTDNMTIKPRVTSLGDGLYSIDTKFKPGDDVEFSTN